MSAVVEAIRGILSPSLRKRLAQAPLVGTLVRRLSANNRLKSVDLTYEPAASSVIAKTLRPGWHCVDLGGHIGRITALCADLVGPSGRVVTFEAFKANAETIRKNMRRLGFQERVHVENIAVTDGGSEFVYLYAGRHNALEEWNVVGHDVTGRSTTPKVKVRACSLDSYFSSTERIDFIKIDIEGAENQALHGMRRILREQKPVLLIEFHNEVGWAAREELYQAGYKLFNMLGDQIVQAPDSPRVYHCLARYPQNK